MSILRKLVLTFALGICLNNQINADKVIMREDFNTSIVELEKKGWTLPEGANLIGNNNEGSSLKIIADQTKYASYYLPIEKGKIYCGKIKVKCFNVKKYKSRDRGAALFFQLADKNKKWCAGGTFPKGIYGTQEKWVEFIVPYTMKMNSEYAFIKILVGIEGNGTAIFDDLVVKEMSNPLVLQEPENNALLKTSQPEFKWSPKYSGVLLLSQNPSFPEDATFSLFDYKTVDCIRPPFALAPGKWYWKVKTFHPDFTAEKAFSFEVAAESPKLPVKIIPLWANRFSAAQPKLTFQIYPQQKIKNIDITLDGVGCKILSNKDGLVTFVPAQNLNKGVYDINITVEKQSFDFVYSTAESSNKITFRKDKIMLLNGKPFFPVGAYRDPSDSLYDFSGLHEAGFNLTHSYSFEDQNVPDIQAVKNYLKLAEENNIKVFMGINRQKIKEIDTVWIQKFCANLKGQKALLTWYLFDEPLAQKLPSICFKEGYQAIKSVDQDTPVSAVFAMLSPDGSKQLINNSLDILWTDNYPVSGAQFDKYYDFLLKSNERANLKPFWCVIQGFDALVWPAGTSKTIKYPTPLQTRLMAHMALSAGATGLLWYWGPKAHAYHISKDAPIVWKGICRTVQEIKQLTPYLVGNREKYSLNVPAQIKYWSAVANSKRVLTLLNISDQPTEISVDLKLSKDLPVKRFSSKETISLNNGKLVERFDGYEVKIYYWEE